MRVGRFNFSHGSHEYHLETLTTLRAACAELNVHCGVLLDTKGPEIRTGFLKNHEPVSLKKDSSLTLTTGEYGMWQHIRRMRTKADMVPIQIMHSKGMRTKLLVHTRICPEM